MTDLKLTCSCGNNKFRILNAYVSENRTEKGEAFASIDLICTKCQEACDLYVKENLDYTINIGVADLKANLKEVEND